VIKFSDVDWVAFNIPQSFGGGVVLSKDRFMGRKNINYPERNKFVSGGGHLSTNVYYNDYNGNVICSTWGVVINSPVTATAVCGGKVEFTNNTPSVTFNNMKTVSFNQLVWQ
jgi:hypothetical protein